MCFASSVVEAHRKLFLSSSTADNRIDVKQTPTTRKRYDSNKRQTAVANSLLAFPAANLKMSRSKARPLTEECGDCGASDPAWASINRGILLCSDCCSVHRSLGRHISIVKSLRQGVWAPSVLNFVNSLNAYGANSVWEHHLLDATPSSGIKGITRLRKPSAKDPLHPNKADFIKAKHVQLAFVLKPTLQDDDNDDVIGSSLEEELSKQLHASVRTSNLETSLRLLVQGADPNFYHEEKHSTPLHMAAKFGQASQIELLIIYGADINAIDGNGLTPLEVATANNHSLIAERLLDSMYEVTDRIIIFLGGKKPDHTSGRHFVVPETAAGEISEQLKIARGRLQLVPNKMFEELVMDLYDEVDRRENEAVWATSTINRENSAVPFLPANPFLSATRNQGRQKLARFSRTEFNGLLMDVLIDARRRQNMATLRPLDILPATSIHSASNSQMYNPITNTSNDLNLSDDEPIYDPVADDDYEPMPPPLPPPTIAQQGVVLHQSAAGIRPEDNYFEMELLRQQIHEYVSEINQLKTVVQQLSNENSELKSKFSINNTQKSANLNEQILNSSIYNEPLHISTSDSGHEPQSLPEDLNTSVNSRSTPPPTANESNSSSTTSSATNSNQSTIKRPASMYERRQVLNLPKVPIDNRNTTSMYQMASNPSKTLTEEVNQRADAITYHLKELIHSMQEPVKRDTLMPCAERIRVAVFELINAFTIPSNCNEVIRDTLMQLNRNNILMQRACEHLRTSYETDTKADINKYTKDVRECAYYIASATKTLVLQLD